MRAEYYNINSSGNHPWAESALEWLHGLRHCTANLSDNAVTLLARLMACSAPLKWPVSFEKAQECSTRNLWSEHGLCPTLHGPNNPFSFSKNQLIKRGWGMSRSSCPKVALRAWAFRDTLSWSEICIAKPQPSEFKTS